MNGMGRIRIFTMTAILFLALTAPLALAAGGDDVVRAPIKLPNPLGEGTTIASLLDRLLDFLAIQLGPVIAAIMIIIGAFQILFAGGDPEKFLVGKRTIIYTVIAYAIILVGKGITLIIKDFLTVK